MSLSGVDDNATSRNIITKRGGKDCSPKLNNMANKSSAINLGT